MKIMTRQLLAGAAGAALMVAAGAAAGAQGQNSAAESSAQSQSTIQMVPALVELEHTLDAKKAKRGDPVTAKLQRDVNLPQQALPKNTVLEGHVDQVQASEHKSDSTVVVTFDKVKLKSGEELAIKATVLAIAEPAYMLQLPNAQAGGAAPSAGNGPVRSAPPEATAGSAAESAGSAPNPDTGMPNQGSQQQPQRNGVPGVTLQSDIHQAASATFTSKGKNVHLPDEMQMDVALAVIPAGVHIQ
ncbi:MAG: hypothetical protein WBW84_09245 [Acidobacteriaceae bacterium]